MISNNMPFIFSFFFLFLSLTVAVISTVMSTLIEPMLTYIEDLKQGNVYWTPTQFSKMTVQTFKDGVPTLGQITNYSTEQLAELRAKTLEVHTHTRTQSSGQLSL